MSAVLVHRLTALLVLMAHLLGATSILPAMVAGTAEVDGGHAVLVTYSDEGPTVRLCHHTGDFTPRAEDHRSFSGRLLATLCESVASGDHVLGGALINAAAPEFKKRMSEPLWNPQGGVMQKRSIFPVFERLVSQWKRTDRCWLPSEFHLRSMATIQIVT